MKKKIDEFLSKFPEKEKNEILSLLKNKQKMLSLLSQPINTSAVFQKDFEINEIPKNGILLSTKGKYRLTKNLIWSGNNNIPLISITGEDITLDFNGFSLSCGRLGENKNGKSKGYYGIHIYNSKKIVIKNGIIKNMNIHGILADTSKNILISDMKIDGLTNQDLTLNPSGILTVACENVIVKDTSVGPIHSIGVNLSGIQMNFTKNSEIINCKVIDIQNQDGVSTGIGHFLSKGVKIINSNVKGLETIFNGHNFGDHTGIGFCPFLSENLYIDECVLEYLVGSCDDAHGMSMFLCKKVDIENCYVKNVSSGLKYGKCAKSTGIEIYGSQMNVKNSKVKDIHTYNPENKQSTGFSVAQGKNITLTNCEAQNVRVYNEKGEEGVSFGYGYGFGWAPDPREMFVKAASKVYYKNCLAEECQVGFDTFFHLNSLWEKVISKANDIPLMNGKENIRTISCSPCSECPQPITNPIKNIAKRNKFLGFKILF